MCNSILLIWAIILLQQQSHHLTPHNIITNKYCITFPKGGGTKGFCFPLSRAWMEEKEIWAFLWWKQDHKYCINRIMSEISRDTFPYSSSYYPLCTARPTQLWHPAMLRTYPLFSSSHYDNCPDYYSYLFCCIRAELIMKCLENTFFALHKPLISIQCQ